MRKTKNVEEKHGKDVRSKSNSQAFDVNGEDERSLTSFMEHLKIKTKAIEGTLYSY